MLITTYEKAIVLLREYGNEIRCPRKAKYPWLWIYDDKSPYIDIWVASGKDCHYSFFNHPIYCFTLNPNDEASFFCKSAITLWKIINHKEQKYAESIIRDCVDKTYIAHCKKESRKELGFVAWLLSFISK